jgi:hypothetical protein
MRFNSKCTVCHLLLAILLMIERQASRELLDFLFVCISSASSVHLIAPQPTDVFSPPEYIEETRQTPDRFTEEGLSQRYRGNFTE